MSAADTGDDLIAEMLPAFIEEAHEQIAAFEQGLLELEDAPDDLGRLDALFRCAHTLKGSAGVFGIDRIVGFTHHVESVLDRLREGRLAMTPSLSTLLLQCNDMIRELVAAAQAPDTEAAAQAREALIERLHAVAGAPGSTPEAGSQSPATDTPTPAPSVWHIEVHFTADTFRHGMDPLTVLSYLAGLGRIEALACAREAVPELEAIDPESCHLGVRFDFHTDATRERIEHAFAFVREDCHLSLEPRALATQAGATAAHPAPQGDATAPAATMPSTAQDRPRDPSPGTGAEESTHIRVQAHRLDEVITLLGELVIAGAGASQLARESRQRALIEANQQITRLIEGIRNSTLKLRMVPIGDTFSRFRRVVRDTAASLGKDVALEIQGGETELDKAMVERIADPMMHLVRNALDHGLEAPEARLAAGKPAQGRLTLSACHESGSVLIRILDDGRGIQRQKVLQRAWERGLVDRGVTPSDEEILRLIFEPGFSTAEQVTNLSGRGVGMDVVRSNIESLRGSVSIESTEGTGSCIEIRLPLTLAIIDGFLVAVGDSRFIFPLDAVVEVIAGRDQAVVLDAQGRGCVDLRGRLLPVLDLRTLYALDSAAPAKGSIVVVRLGTRRFGVMVDTLLGQHQTVIKPLSRLLRSLRGISGSSILGSGDVALIFDIDALARLACDTRALAASHPSSGPLGGGTGTPSVGEP